MVSSIAAVGAFASGRIRIDMFIMVLHRGSQRRLGAKAKSGQSPYRMSNQAIGGWHKSFRVWTPGKNGEGAVKLLHEHHAGKLVRNGK